MQLLPGQNKQTQFIGFVIVVGLLLIGHGHSEPNDANKGSIGGIQLEPEESAVTKGPKDASPSHPAEILLQGVKLETVTEKAAAAALLNNSEQKNDVAAPPQKPTKKTGIINSQTATDSKTITVPHQAASPAATSSSSSYLYHPEETIINSDEEISDSLKAGFYFFVALSLSAISFIVFKVYRLRLSRAERKYGVQGDRSTQELTPLPIAIDDGPSDDEDQTLFEVQRQNIHDAINRS